jgi:hypothetical protein
MTQWSRLKPLLPKDDFCRRGFSPEPVFEAAKGPGEGHPCNPEPPSSMTQRSRRKLLLPKDDFCRRGFSPEPVFEAAKGPGEGHPCNPEPASSMTQRSRRKLLLPKDDFCRRGFSPEPPSSRMRWSEWKPPRQLRTSSFRRHKGSRLKPLLPFEPCLPDPAKVAAKAAPTNMDAEMNFGLRRGLSPRTLRLRRRRGRGRSRSCENRFGSRPLPACPSSGLNLRAISTPQINRGPNGCQCRRREP